MPALMSPPTNGAGCGGIHAGGRPGSSAVRSPGSVSRYGAAHNPATSSFNRMEVMAVFPAMHSSATGTPTSETTRCRKRSTRCPSRSRPS